MKKVNYKIKTILALMLVSCFLYPIISFKGGIEYLNLFNIGYWVVLLIIAYFMIGYSKSRSIAIKDTMQLVIIYSMTYILFSYLLGLITGFANIPFSLKLISILKNILPFLIYLIVREMLRYILLNTVKKNRYYIVLITFIYIVMDIVTTTSIYDFGNFEDIFLFIGISVIGNTFKNILLSYMSLHVGEKAGILYVLLTEGYVYIVPFVPNLGTYFETIINISLPTLLILHLTKLYEIDKKVKLISSKYTKLFRIPIILAVISVVVLVSGIFKYRAFAIASNSMQPTFSRGAVIILEDYDKEMVFKKGDIIAVSHDKKIIVHRVEKVYKQGNKYLYTTKGDNNPVEDSYQVTEDDIVGYVHFWIPFAGYPSVWLSELLN